MNIKFDATKPYGQVWGDSDVAYVQDGHDFDVMGKLVDEQQTFAVLDNSEDNSDTEKFLKKLLSGGPMLMSNVYKDAENAKFNWNDILKTAADIGIMRTKVKGVETWEIKG